jgi:Phage capsid protein
MSAAIQAVYRDRAVAAFERRTSFLEQAVSHETITQGGTVYFLVHGSGGRSAVTRGADGLIPAADDLQIQVPVIFREDHDLIRRNNFNIFTAQSNQRDIMAQDSNGVVRRKMDDIIIAAIATGTVTLGAVGTMTKDVANKILARFGNADVMDADGNSMLYSLLSPSAWALMTDITSFGNANYSMTGGHMERGMGGPNRWTTWVGINWAMHTGLSGKGTAACTCLAWHKNAVAHATSPAGLQAMIDRNDEQDYSYVRHSIYHAAALLQNSGVVKFVHDDSTLSL